MLFHLRDAFRAGDVWLARSLRYGDIRKALLSAPAVADADRSLPVPASPHDWLAERRSALDEGLRRRRKDGRRRAGRGRGPGRDLYRRRVPTTFVLRYTLRASHLELGGVDLDLAVEDDVLPLDRADMTQQVGVEREVRRGGQP